MKEIEYFYDAAFNFLWAAFQSATLFFKLSWLTSSKMSTPKRAGKLYLWCRSSGVILSNTSWGSSKSRKMLEFDEVIWTSRIYLESCLRCAMPWHSSEARQFLVAQPNWSRAGLAAYSDLWQDLWPWGHLRLWEDCKCCFPMDYKLQWRCSAAGQLMAGTRWDLRESYLLLWPFQQFRLLQIGMCLYLVDSRRNLCAVQN